MEFNNIAQNRLKRQLLIDGDQKTPKDVVAWMGAMQAQDFPMARWAIGARSPGTLDSDIITAINNGEIIRTHLLRPTWHFVSAEDITWMIDLTAPQIRNSQKARNKDLELTEEIYSQSNQILEKALSKENYLSRDDLVAELGKAKIKTDQNRASHIFMRAELEKIVCSGMYVNGKLTYASFPARVSSTRKLAKDEALGELARRYFTSRSPATVNDFQWWSGLTARNARLALELVRSNFHEEHIFNKTYWLPDGNPLPDKKLNSAHLLPTYDEYLVSYVGREAAISAELASFMNEISNRGIFRPVMILNGQVIGTWKRTITKDLIIIELHPFSQVNQTMMKKWANSIERYASFHNMKAEAQFQ